MQQDRFQKLFVVLLVVFISLLFLAMLRPFLMTILLAAIFSGLVQPLHRRILAVVRGRRAAAAALTLFFFILVILVPLLGVLGIVAGQAYQVSLAVVPWVQHLRDATLDPAALARLPYVQELLEALRPHWSVVVAKGGQLAASGSSFLVDKLSAATRGTVQVAFQIVVFLYSMFFFLKDGGAILARMLYFLPLPEADERRMMGKFVSVTRAMLKGTLTIALLQGSLTGIAFALAGIDGAVFWGTLAVLLAMVPGLGAPLVWAPAVIYLFASGHVGRAVAVLVFCAGIVGTLDNFLRPRLVGRDTQMHDLMVFFGVLGGIALFGLVGFIVGPILAALFVTIWDIYGIVFRDYLPKALGGVRAATAAPAAPAPPPPRDDNDA